MTREEKQKAIDALKISAPVMAMTQEEFNDYIQTLNKVMDWLEQEPTKNDLEVDCIKKSDVIDIIQDMHGLARADVISDAVNRIITMPSVTPQPRKGYLSIDDVMSVFDDFMCGEVDEDGTETFLEMLKDKADMRED